MLAAWRWSSCQAGCTVPPVLTLWALLGTYDIERVATVFDVATVATEHKHGPGKRVIGVVIGLLSWPACSTGMHVARVGGYDHGGYNHSPGLDAVHGGGGQPQV